MSEIKILIIEDEPLIAADIAQCLTNLDFCVSGIAYNTSDALQELETNLPDAILLDINLHEERDGIDLAGVINAKYKLPFVFLTSHADRLTLERAIKTIPAGYILFSSLFNRYFSKLLIMKYLFILFLVSWVSQRNFLSFRSVYKKEEK